MTDPPLKPTRTLADVIARFRKQLDETLPATPKPLTDAVPPKPWSDPQQDEGDEA